jgi:hypothetical protein
MNIATEYASLKDSRPELIGGLNNNVNIKPEENNKKRVIRINENKFMNMTLGQIFDKIE